MKSQLAQNAEHLTIVFANVALIATLFIIFARIYLANSANGWSNNREYLQCIVRSEPHKLRIVKTSGFNSRK